MAGGFFAFLFLPFLCDLPIGWGLLSGALLFALQLAWGDRLVMKLLRWEAVTEAHSALRLQPGELLIASDCPMALSLNGLRFTRALRNGAVTAEMADEWQRLALPAPEAAYLSRLLAVPCLLRAFEALTNSYGNLRLSEGPLWYLGRLLGVLALLLEWPLRHCWGENRPECRLCSYLRAELIKQEKLPAWVRALDLLSPVSISQTERMRRRQLLYGIGESEESAQPREEQQLSVLHLGGLPGGILSCAGLMVALSPWQFWGALPLGIGLDVFLWIMRRWPRYQRQLSPEEAGNISPEGQDPVAVCWRGRLVPAPKEMAFENFANVLQWEKGMVALVKLPASVRSWAEKATDLEICGWFNLRTCELQADRVRGEQRCWNNHFRWKCAVWPVLLAASGAAWWYLQCVGL